MLRIAMRACAILISSFLPVFVAAEWLGDKTPGDKTTATNTTAVSSNAAARPFGKPYVNMTNYLKASLIQALYNADQRAVFVSWEDCTNLLGGVPSYQQSPPALYQYNIYVSPAIINSATKLAQAKLLGTVKAGTRQYRHDVTTFGTNYYAVAVVDGSRIEYFKPEYDQTYTAEGTVVEIVPGIVAGLRATFDEAQGVVTLSWTKAPEPDATCRVFFSTDGPLAGAAQKAAAIKAVELPAGSTAYRFQAPREGTFWFLVTSVLGGKESRRYVADGNYTSQGLAARPASRPAAGPTLVKAITASFDAVTSILKVGWQYGDTTVPGLRIYSGNTEPITKRDLLAGSKLLKVSQPGETLTGLQIATPPAGRWFFAVVSYDSTGRESTNFAPGLNATWEAVVVPGRDVALRTNVALATNRVSLTNTVFMTNLVTLYRTNVLYTTNQLWVTNDMGTNKVWLTNTVWRTNLALATNNGPATNAVTITNTLTLTNTVQLTNTVTLTNTVQLTNFITNNAATNTVVLTNFATNTIQLTNTLVLTNFVTNTNMVQMTNTLVLTNFVTNTNTVQLTNTFTNTNTVTLTNTLQLTNTVTVTNAVSTNAPTRHFTNTLYVTNTRVLTNTVHVTNWQTRENRDTRQTNVERGDRDRGDRDRGYRSVDEGEATALRGEIRAFYKASDARDRDRLLSTVVNLRRIQVRSADQAVRDQCALFIGQAYFRLGDYMSAMREFVRLRDRMPDEAAFWIRRCTEYLR